jgi:hypothetical protein
VFGVGIYAYFTTPLPFGLNAVIRTPGGSAVAGGTPQPVVPGIRTAAGQPLVLGATSVVVQAVQRGQDLAANNRGPVGSFTLLQIEVQNGGNDPFTPQASDFRLVDDRGRSYAVDLEATRAVNAAARRRLLFDATVPPAGRVTTLLAFETPADVGSLTLRVALGYGEVELPR